MNFKICGRRTALTSIQLTTKSWAMVYQTKAQDMNNLKHHLIDAQVGVEQSIIDNAIDQRRRRLHPCI